MGSQEHTKHCVETTEEVRKKAIELLKTWEAELDKEHISTDTI
jgi:hypothetical protein